MILNPGQKVSALPRPDGARKEVSSLTAVADTGVKEVARLTFQGSAGAAQADYFTFTNVAGTVWAVWLDFNSAGTQPDGAIFLAVSAPNRLRANCADPSNATAVAAAVHAAIGSSFTDVTVTDNLNGTIDFTQNKMGNPANPVPKSAHDAGAGSIAVSVTTAGVASNLLNKYVTLARGENQTQYYCWMNVNSEGVDPAVSGKTGVSVALAAAASAGTVATAIAAALDALPGFVASAVSADVTITNAEFGGATDINVGNSPFTVSVSTQGASRYPRPGDSPVDESNDPSASQFVEIA